jgi:hypothetical protein
MTKRKQTDTFVTSLVANKKTVVNVQIDQLSVSVRNSVKLFHDLLSASSL